MQIDELVLVYVSANNTITKFAHQRELMSGLTDV